MRSTVGRSALKNNKKQGSTPYLFQLSALLQSDLKSPSNRFLAHTEIGSRVIQF